MSEKMNLSILTKHNAADSEIGLDSKSISKPFVRAKASAIAWELTRSLKVFTKLTIRIPMKYNKTAVEALMGHHVAKISILRNPEDQILSSWDFFRHIGELAPFENAIAKKTNRRMKNQDLFVEFINNFEEYKDLSPMFPRRFVNPQARKKIQLT